MENEQDNQSRSGNRITVRRPTKYRLIKKTGTINIIEITGRMSPNEANDELCKRLDALIDSGERYFLLDLSGVTYISSTGVGSLLQCYHHVERADGKFKLLTPSQCVSHIINVSKLDTVFEIFDNETVAVESFEVSATPEAADKKIKLRKTKS